MEGYPNMKNIIFTRQLDKGLSIVTVSPKNKIEEMLGTLSDQQYRDHIYERSIPQDAIKVREIDPSIIPQDWTFRDAWCDVTDEERIDIDLSKARDIQLEILRQNRTKAFSDLGHPNKLNKELEDQLLSPETRLELERLRDITEPLKSLDLKGKFNDKNLLNEIKRLGTL